MEIENIEKAKADAVTHHARVIKSPASKKASKKKRTAHIKKVEHKKPNGFVLFLKSKVCQQTIASAIGVSLGVVLGTYIKRHFFR